MSSSVYPGGTGRIAGAETVFVSYGDQVFMEATLTRRSRNCSALRRRKQRRLRSANRVPEARGLINQAVEHYNKAIAAQKSGDWATYGTEIQAAETL